jgi:hypothetical protein
MTWKTRGQRPLHAILRTCSCGNDRNGHLESISPNTTSHSFQASFYTSATLLIFHSEMLRCLVLPSGWTQTINYQGNLLITASAFLSSKTLARTSTIFLVLTMLASAKSPAQFQPQIDPASPVTTAVMLSLPDAPGFSSDTEATSGQRRRCRISQWLKTPPAHREPPRDHHPARPDRSLPQRTQ